MLKRPPMGDIQSYYDSGSGPPYPNVAIQCVNGRYPMAHGLDVISCNIHPTAQVEIPT